MLPYCRRLLESMPGEPGRVQEARGLAGLADDCVVVGAHLVVAPPGGLDRQVGEEGQAPRRVSRDTFDRRLAPAEDKARSFPVEVEPGRKVDRQREFIGQAASVPG